MKRLRIYNIALICWALSLAGFGSGIAAEDFPNHATQTFSIYIDFGNDTPFYSMDLNNGMMYPLSEGSITVHIDTTQLEAILTDNNIIQSSSFNGGLAQDYASGALQLSIVPTPFNTIIAGDPVPVTDTSPVTLPFKVGYLTPAMAELPLTLKLYNTSSGSNMLLRSSEENIYQPTDDRPFGAITSINTSDSIHEYSIVNGDEVIISGWAFDDNDSLAIPLYVRQTETDTASPADTVVSRFINAEKNAEIPYWGDSYPSGFDITWHTGSARGRHLLNAYLDDGGHEIALAEQKVFINKQPAVAIESPQPYTAIHSDEFIISGTAIDLDVDVELGAYLSCVEIYLDDPATVIDVVTNNTLDSQQVDFEVTWTNITQHTNGEHTLYAVARDSFGLVSDIIAIPVMLYTMPPSVDSVSPRLGPWQGNTTVTLNGEGFSGLQQVLFGSNTATVLSGGTDTLVQVTVDPVANPASEYVQLRLSNEVGSYFSDDAYRFIPAHLNTTQILLGDIADMAYSNIEGILYVLDKENHTIERFVHGQSTATLLEYDGSILTSGDDLHKECSILLSRFEDILFVTYEQSNRIDIFDMNNNAALVDSIEITDSSGADVVITSIAYIIGDEYAMRSNLLVTTNGLEPKIILIDIDPDNYAHVIEEIPLTESYTDLRVYGCTNGSTAYLAAFDATGGDVAVYRYDASDALMSDRLPVAVNAAAFGTDQTRIAVNYNGSDFMLYSDNDTARFDRNGTLLGSSPFGANSLLYDACRPIYYTVDEYDMSFQIMSLEDIEQELTFCHFPDNDYTSGVLTLDWYGDYLFAATSQGIAVVQIGDIYPEIRNMQQFAEAGHGIEFTVANTGALPENVEVSIGGKQAESSYDAHTDTHTVSSLPDNDAADTVRATLYGYPGKAEKIYRMNKLIDLVDNAVGLEYFYPAGLFYDDARGDLYAFDPSQTGGFSIARFHIDVDAAGNVAVTRRHVPAAMQVDNPISMTRVHDYIIVLSRYSRQCVWFNVEEFDAPGDAQVSSAGMSPYITPSGIVGYSPAGNTGMRIAYLWHSVSTGGIDLFQLDLNTGQITWCNNIMSPHTTNVYIDHHSSDYTLDRAYAVSSTVRGTDSDFVTVFEPYQSASDVVAVRRINLPESSGTHSVMGNGEHLFVTTLTSKGVYMLDQDDYDIYNIMLNDTKSSRFCAVDDRMLALSGKKDDASFEFSLIDTHFWNDYPYMAPFDTVVRYTPSQTSVYDVEFVKGKLVTILGKTLYIIDVRTREE